LERKLFIHVGPMKTGTTALQTFLRDHDGSLVLYPKKTGQYDPGAHHNRTPGSNAMDFAGAFGNSFVRRRPDNSNAVPSTISILKRYRAASHPWALMQLSKRRCRLILVSADSMRSQAGHNVGGFGGVGLGRTV
jgi:hypothetical protein